MTQLWQASRVNARGGARQVARIGKFFQRTDVPPALHEAEPILDEVGPLAHRKLGGPPEVAKDFIAELM